MAEVTKTNRSELANLWQRADDLAAAVVRVRMLHRRADSWSGCVECSETHPCRTIRALDGEVLDADR